MNEIAGGLQATRDRAIPLSTRRDLIAKEIGYQGTGYWVIKDPVALKYYRLTKEQYCILEALKENRTLIELKQLLQFEFPTTPVKTRDVQRLLSDLHEKNLLFTNRRGQGHELLAIQQKNQLKQIMSTAQNFLFLRLPGFDPEWMLVRMLPWLSWMFSRWAFTFCVALASAALLLVAIEFNTFRARLPEFQQFFGWPNLLYLWATLAITKLIHEFGHGLSCKYYGGECHKIGVMLLVFSPTLYCDVSDSWMLKNKWHRIIIGGAGAYIEVVLSSLAIFAWWFSEPGLFNHLCLNVFFLSTVSTVIFNLNPLIRFDGYYMLADFLEIPNLRQKADRALTRTIAWYCFGIHIPEDPFTPDRDRHWFILYAIAAWCYRWVLVIGIAMFLYAFLKPYGLQNLGITMAVISIGTMVYGMIRGLIQIFKTPRNEPMNYFKVTATTVVLGGLAVVILAIPVPWWINSSFIVEPYGVKHVHALESAELKEVYVKPGQQITQGDKLMDFHSPDLERQLLELETQLKVANRHVETVKHIQNPGELAMGRERVKTIESQIAQMKQRIAKLTVFAPIDGKVIAAESRDSATRPLADREQLQGWSGTLFQKKNSHAFVEVGTPLLSIAPSEQMQAVLIINQDDRNDIKEGQPVSLRCYHVVDQIYSATIERISARQTNIAPKALSNKAKGDLVTVTDSQGRERLTDTSYQAIVKLPADSDLMITGVRGRARFIVDKRTVGQWIWRYLQQTFYFRM